MPYSQDYIKRMIEQFGEFLLALKQLLAEDRRADAREQIDAAYKALLGMDADFIRQSPDDYLILACSMAQVGDLDKAAVLGDLLAADGDWQALNGDYETAQTCYQKAARLLIETLMRQPFGTSAAYVEKIDALIEKLEHDGLPFDLRERLFRYHERVGRYADAEDHLFDLLAEGPDDPTLLEAGIAFYERLLALKDHELLLGGLPRDEALAGLAELEARLR
jgi:tetratricopeptide (TPR) repeat protein